MQRRPDLEPLEMRCEPAGPDPARHLDQHLDQGDGERDQPNRGEGGDDLDAGRGEQLAAHRRRESLRQQSADFGLEGGEVAIPSVEVRMEISTDYAAARDRFRAQHVELAGVKPIRESLYGLAFADEKKRALWIEDMRRHGKRGD